MSYDRIEWMNVKMKVEKRSSEKLDMVVMRISILGIFGNLGDVMRHHH